MLPGQNLTVYVKGPGRIVITGVQNSANVTQPDIRADKVSSRKLRSPLLVLYPHWHAAARLHAAVVNGHLTGAVKCMVQHDISELCDLTLYRCIDNTYCLLAITRVFSLADADFQKASAVTAPFQYHSHSSLTA